MFFDHYIDVCFPAPPFGPLTYILPGDTPIPPPGARVVVPLGKRAAVGLCLGAAGAPAAVEKLKSVMRVLDGEAFCGEVPWDLVQMCARRYASSVGEAIRLALPVALDESRDDLVMLAAAFLARGENAGLSDEEKALVGAVWEAGWMGRRALGRDDLVAVLSARGVFIIEPYTTKPPAEDVVIQRVGALPKRTGKAGGALWERVGDGGISLASLAPGPSERQALRKFLGARALVAGLTKEKAVSAPVSPRAELISGGDASARLAAARERVGEAADGLIVVVPEIYKIAETLNLCRQLWGEPFLPYHSGMAAGARWEVFRRCRRGTVRRVVGTPAALFLPLGSKAAVVLCDEGDHAYKGWERAPYIHARDVALARAAQSVLAMTSPAPSLEAYHRAAEASAELVNLPPPKTAAHATVVDMERAVATEGPVLLSSPLVSAMQEALAVGRRAVIVVNRRGYIPYLYCDTCGRALACPACDVAFVYHKDENVLRCHYCSRREPLPPRCPACGKETLIGVGFGAERLEREVSLLFPEARLGRADSDALATEARARAFWSRWAAGGYDVVVGTQMALRACEDAAVGLAVLANADAALHLPDFRSAEWTYRTIRRLMEPPAPRRIIIQTFNPAHPAIAAAVTGDYEAFARRELAYRRRLGFPPFSELVNVIVEAFDSAQADSAAASLRQCLREVFGDRAAIEGPVPAAVARARGRFRRQLLVKTTRAAVAAVSPALAALAVRKRDLAVRIDVDPYELF